MRKLMILVNEFLEVQIDPKGAELRSLISRDSGYEFLWGADPRYWAKTSPVLFPIVGALKADTYVYKGKTYRLPRHGFARDCVFAASQLSDAEAVFTLSDNDETRLVYPFPFRLSLRYRLMNRSLECTYEVNNPADSDTLLFSVGGHPAFAAASSGTGLHYEDYFLEFPDDDELVCHKLEGNLISSQVKTIPLQNHRLPLRHELFYSDALVLKTLRSNTVALKNRVNEREVRLNREGFPYFGVWAAKDADFVCLEPWCGIADHVAHGQLWNEKEGLQRLEAGQRWARTWEVQLT